MTDNIFKYANDIDFQRSSNNKKSVTIAGQVKTQKLSPDFYELSVNLPLLTKEQYDKVEADLLSIEDGLLTTNTGINDKIGITYFEGNLSPDSVTIDDALSNGNTITFLNALPESNVKAGDFIQFANSTKVYQVAEDSAANNVGTITIKIHGSVINSVKNASVSYGVDDGPINKNQLFNIDVGEGGTGQTAQLSILRSDGTNNTRSVSGIRPTAAQFNDSLNTYPEILDSTLSPDPVGSFNNDKSVLRSFDNFNRTRFTVADLIGTVGDTFVTINDVVYNLVTPLTAPSFSFFITTGLLSTVQANVSIVNIGTYEGVLTELDNDNKNLTIYDANRFCPQGVVSGGKYTKDYKFNKINPNLIEVSGIVDADYTKFNGSYDLINYSYTDTGAVITSISVAGNNKYIVFTDIDHNLTTRLLISNSNVTDYTNNENYVRDIYISETNPITPKAFTYVGSKRFEVGDSIYTVNTPEYNTPGFDGNFSGTSSIALPLRETGVYKHQTEDYYVWNNNGWIISAEGVKESSLVQVTGNHSIFDRVINEWSNTAIITYGNNDVVLFGDTLYIARRSFTQARNADFNPDNWSLAQVEDLRGQFEFLFSFVNLFSIGDVITNSLTDGLEATITSFRRVSFGPIGVTVTANSIVDNVQTITTNAAHNLSIGFNVTNRDYPDLDPNFNGVVGVVRDIISATEFTVLNNPLNRFEVGDEIYGPGIGGFNTTAEGVTFQAGDPIYKKEFTGTDEVWSFFDPATADGEAILVKDFEGNQEILNGIYTEIPSALTPSFSNNFNPDGTASIVSSTHSIYKHSYLDLYIWNRQDTDPALGGWHISFEGLDLNGKALPWAFLSIIDPQNADEINNLDWRSVEPGVPASPTLISEATEASTSPTSIVGDHDRLFESRYNTNWKLVDAGYKTTVPVPSSVISDATINVDSIGSFGTLRITHENGIIEQISLPTTFLSINNLLNRLYTSPNVLLVGHSNNNFTVQFSSNVGNALPQIFIPSITNQIIYFNKQISKNDFNYYRKGITSENSLDDMSLNGIRFDFYPTQGTLSSLTQGSIYLNGQNGNVESIPISANTFRPRSLFTQLQGISNNSQFIDAQEDNVIGGFSNYITVNSFTGVHSRYNGRYLPASYFPDFYGFNPKTGPSVNLGNDNYIHETEPFFIWCRAQSTSSSIVIPEESITELATIYNWIISPLSDKTGVVTNTNAEVLFTGNNDNNGFLLSLNADPGLVVGDLISNSEENALRRLATVNQIIPESQTDTGFTIASVDVVPFSNEVRISTNLPHNLNNDDLVSNSATGDVVKIYNAESNFFYFDSTTANPFTVGDSLFLIVHRSVRVDAKGFFLSVGDTLYKTEFTGDALPWVYSSGLPTTGDSYTGTLFNNANVWRTVASGETPINSINFINSTTRTRDPLPNPAITTRLVSVINFTGVDSIFNETYVELEPTDPVPTFSGNFNPVGTTSEILPGSRVYKHLREDIYIWFRTDGGWHISFDDTSHLGTPVPWAFLNIAASSNPSVYNSVARPTIPSDWRSVDAGVVATPGLVSNNTFAITQGNIRVENSPTPSLPFSGNLYNGRYHPLETSEIPTFSSEFNPVGNSAVPVAGSIVYKHSTANVAGIEFYLWNLESTDTNAGGWHLSGLAPIVIVPSFGPVIVPWNRLDVSDPQNSSFINSTNWKNTPLPQTQNNTVYRLRNGTEASDAVLGMTFFIRFNEKFGNGDVNFISENSYNPIFDVHNSTIIGPDFSALSIGDRLSQRGAILNVNFTAAAGNAEMSLTTPGINVDNSWSRANPNPVSLVLNDEILLAGPGSVNYPMGTTVGEYITDTIPVSGPYTWEVQYSDLPSDSQPGFSTEDDPEAGVLWGGPGWGDPPGTSVTQTTCSVSAMAVTPIPPGLINVACNGRVGINEIALGDLVSPNPGGPFTPVLRIFGDGDTFNGGASLGSGSFLIQPPNLSVWAGIGGALGKFVHILNQNNNGNAIITSDTSTIEGGGEPSKAGFEDNTLFVRNRQLYGIEQTLCPGNAEIGERTYFRTGNDVRFKFQLSRRPQVTIVPGPGFNYYQYDTFNFKEIL